MLIPWEAESSPETNFPKPSRFYAVSLSLFPHRIRSRNVCSPFEIDNNRISVWMCGGEKN